MRVAGPEKRLLGRLDAARARLHRPYRVALDGARGPRSADRHRRSASTRAARSSPRLGGRPTARSDASRRAVATWWQASSLPFRHGRSRASSVSEPDDGQRQRGGDAAEGHEVYPMEGRASCGRGAAAAGPAPPPRRRARSPAGARERPARRRTCRPRPIPGAAAQRGDGEDERAARPAPPARSGGPRAPASASPPRWR